MSSSTHLVICPENNSACNKILQSSDENFIHCSVAKCHTLMDIADVCSGCKAPLCQEHIIKYTLKFHNYRPICLKCISNNNLMICKKNFYAPICLYCCLDNCRSSATYICDKCTNAHQ